MDRNSTETIMKPTEDGAGADCRPSRRAFLGSAALAVTLSEERASALRAGGPVAAPAGFMCELMAFPERVALTTAVPAFAWMAGFSATDTLQTAYELQVASQAVLLMGNQPDLWDSGRISGGRSSGIVYRGKPLPSNSDLFWRVRAWYGSGKLSPWSSAQAFRTGEHAATRAIARYPIVQSEIRPKAIVDNGEGRWFVDFGRAAFGRVRLSRPVQSPAGRVTVSLGEAKLPGDGINPRPGGSVRFLKTDVTVGADPVMAPDRVMPFRYVEIAGWTDRLTLESVVQIADHYPFDDSAAHFHSSDAVLNDVWDLCKYSIEATSFLGIYIDGDRERKPYEADAYINQLGHYCVDREYTLARYSHETLLAHSTWPTEWQLHSVLIAWADYLYTGDIGSLAATYDLLEAKTLSALARPDGLIGTTTGLVTPAFLESIHTSRIQDIVDWPAGERDGYQFGPINTVVNAFHFAALARMCSIAAALGKRDEARRFAERADRVQTSFNAILFDHQRGLYRDSEGAGHCSLHANMFPLAFGLAPLKRIPVIADFVKSRGMACSVYGAQYLLEALYNAGLGDAALALMTARTERSWAHMLYDVGSTITLEAWDNRFKPNQDWNHAWGAAPANIIPRRLMGIEPLEPGYARMRIKPQPGSLRSAEIKTPTIRGPVEMRFESTPDIKFHMETVLPVNTRATVYLPGLGTGARVDGRKRTAARDNGFWRIDDVGSGAHVFECGA